jgi:hypothetical protein
MMLLSDGTALVQGAGISNTWYKLTADSTGSFLNGSWSTQAPMGTPRLYFGSNVLPSGQVFVQGGEYTSAGQVWTNTGEVYDPVANSWSAVATFPQSQFGDDPTIVLPNGKILAGYLSGPQTYLYDPAANTWTQAGTKLRSDRSDEETWVMLPDGSVLSYDVWSTIATGTSTAQRYIPATNTWVDAGTLPVALSSSALGYELGPAFLLPDGRVFQIGANSNTALYTPSTNTWAQGPTIPGGAGADDAPGAVLPNGHVIFAADTPLFHGPTQLFDFDPVANTITAMTSLPAGLTSELSGAAYTDRMLVLPSGQVLFGNGNSSQLWLYTPAGAPSDSWRPTVSSVTANGTGGTYTLTGTQLNGLSEGAAYGDDAEMSSNYPVVQLTDSSGNVSFARTFGWTPGVATGSSLTSTQFTLPSGLAPGVYSLEAIANGIASAPFSFNTFPGLGVIGSTPANGSLVTAAPTSFVIDFNEPIQPGTVQASDLAVNGIAAGGVTLDPTNQVATFTYAASPVTTDGVQSMDIAANLITGQDGTQNFAFHAAFRYDAVTLAVASTNPPVGGAFTIPAGSFTFDVTFNEPIDPATAGVANLTLSQGTVSAATVLAGNTTVRYTLTGLAAEGALTIGIPAGQLRDQADNPGFTPFSAGYQVDIGTATFPTPLTAQSPAGSLIYGGSTAALVNFAGDTDNFTLNIDPGQTVTLLVTPTDPGLQPTVQLLDPSGQTLGSAVAAAAGQNALLQATATTTGGTYTIGVGGASGKVGHYTVRATLNAALENEGTVVGASNDTPATAQDLGPSFVTVQTSLSQAQRGAVVGTTDNNTGPVDYYSFAVSAGQSVAVALTGLAAGNLNMDLIDADGTTVLASGVAGATNVTKAISSLAFSAAGTYYVRVTGDPNVPYNLVITKNAAFDLHPNGAAGAAQDLTGTNGVLGALSGSNSYQATAVPYGFEEISATGTAVLQGVDDSYAQVTPGGGFQFSLYGTAYTTLYVSSNGLITFGSGNNAYANQDLTSSPGQAAIAPFWDDLVVPASGGAVYWQLVGSGTGQHLVIEWQNVRFYAGTTVDLTFEAALGVDGSIRFNYQNLTSGTTGNDEGASATVGIKDLGVQGANRLLLAFNNGPNSYVGSGKSTLINPPADWYRVTLAAGQTALQLETSTPADGPGAFGNTLDPHLQLFDAANNLVAAGTPLADGRNESIAVNGLTAGGTYYVRVSAENNTTGEYYLGTVPSQQILPDIIMGSVQTAGGNTLTVTYQVTGIAVSPFRLGFYSSADTAFDPGDTLLSTVQVSDQALLLVGSHNLTLTVGGGAGQVALPGAGLALGPGGSYLLAVANDDGAVSESSTADNTALFAGTYHTPGGDVVVHGTDQSDTITIATSGTHLVLTVNGSATTYAAADVAAFDLYPHGGTDSAGGSGVAKPMRFFSGPGNETLSGGTGVNTLVGPDQANVWTLTGANAGTLNSSTFSRIANLTGGALDDRFTIEPGASLSGTLDGGTGTNTLDYSAFTTALTVNLQTQTCPSLTKAWAHIGALVGGSGNNTLIGPNATNTWVIGGPNVGAVGGVAFTGFQNLTGGTGSDTFQFTAGGSVAGKIDGKVGTNRLDYSAYGSAATVNLQTKTATGIGATWLNIQSATGTGTADTLIGANVANTWTVTGPNAGTVNGTFAFAGFVNLTGGSAKDAFVFQNGAGVAGLIDGKAGVNALDYSAYTTGIYVNLLTGTATGTGGIANIRNVNGGQGNDILVGDNNANVFTETGGSNLLIGGGGKDSPTAGSGGDILIGGRTSYDTNAAALQALLAAWDQAAVGYGDRVAALQAGVTYTDGTGTHTAALNPTTVFDDAAADVLTGGSGLDWFFAHPAGTSKDTINNLQSDEVVTSI